MGINDTKFDIASRKIKNLRRRTKFLLSYSLIWIILNVILIFAVVIALVQYQQKMLDFKKSTVTEEVVKNQKLFFIIAIILLCTINVILFLVKVIFTNLAFRKNKELEEFYEDTFTRSNKMLRIGGYFPFIGLFAYFSILIKANKIWVELQTDLVNKKDEIKINETEAKQEKKPAPVKKPSATPIKKPEQKAKEIVET